MVDDLGFSDFGCYGSEIQTPNIDKLAESGLRFTQFYNTAKCHSSRVCLMSGQWCHMADKPRSSGEGLASAATIAEVLKPAGYFTAMTGKWHLKGNPHTDWGFDRYFGHLSGATSFFEGDNTFRLDDKPWSEFGRDFYTTDANTDWGMKFIEEGLAQKKPFLLYIAHNAPHYPLHVREPDFRKYEETYKDGWDKLRKARFEKQKKLGIFPADAKLPERPEAIPAWVSLNAEQKDWERRRMAAFAGMVDRVDQQMGRLTAFLKEKGVLENTVIMLFADNGGCPFDRTKGKEYEPWDPRSYWTYDTSWAWMGNTPFKYYKQNQHEGGIRSPMITHWPAGLKAKGFTSQPAHLVDILPTLVELGGGTYPKKQGERTVRPHDGISMADIFAGKERKGHKELFFHYGNNRALRQNDWKLASCSGGAWELYNLKSDPFEELNVSSSHPEKVAAMSQRYEEMWGASLKLKDEPGVPTTHKSKDKTKKKKK
jgi:arylsulfatase